MPGQPVGRRHLRQLDHRILGHRERQRAPDPPHRGDITGLSFPIGIDLDASGNLYVSNQFGGIESFSFPANGNRTPADEHCGRRDRPVGAGRLAVAPPLSVRTTSPPPAAPALSRRAGGLPWHGALCLQRRAGTSAGRAAPTRRGDQRPATTERHVSLHGPRPGRVAAPDARLAAPGDHRPVLGPSYSRRRWATRSAGRA